MLQRLFIGILLTVSWCVPLTSIAADIQDGLVLYLPLNEGRGQDVKDLGPFHFKTEMSEKPPEWVKVADNPLIDTALKFDGKENFVMIDMAGQGHDIDSHVDKQKGLSICAWVKVIKTGTDGHGQTRQPVVMKGAGGGWEFALYVYDGALPGMSVWNCAGSGVAEPSGGVLGKEWHYMCGTFDLKDGVAVYLDGDENPVTQGAVGGNAPCDGTRPVFIAHREDGQWLNAIIAEVRMWERVISVDEMKLAMQSIGGGLPVRPAGLLTTVWGEIRTENREMR